MAVMTNDQDTQEHRRVKRISPSPVLLAHLTIARAMNSIIAAEQNPPADNEYLDDIIWDAKLLLGRAMNAVIEEFGGEVPDHAPIGGPPKFADFTDLAIELRVYVDYWRPARIAAQCLLQVRDQLRTMGII